MKGYWLHRGWKPRRNIKIGKHKMLIPPESPPEANANAEAKPTPSTEAIRAVKAALFEATLTEQKGRIDKKNSREGMIQVICSKQLSTA